MILFRLLPLLSLVGTALVESLVAPLSISEHFQLTRGRLAQALSSPSGKLTLSPELVIPEPQDSTAILLQTNAVQTLSERVRSSKANAAFVQGSLTSLQIFCNEQELARGRLPGPVPAIYCLKEIPTGDNDNIDCTDIPAIAASGADGVMIRVCGGKAIATIDDILADSTFQTACDSAIQSGIQPIPEVTVSQSMAAGWSETDLQNLIAACTKAMGDQEPVSIVLTAIDDAPADGEEEQSSHAVVTPLPQIPKSLVGKRIPILGSVRVTAGENRLGIETARFKEAGFHGAILRSDCVPGFRMQVDLNFVANFWYACISDLKSTKSKAFSFRSKNNMEKSVATQWGNYQRSVIESGALGDAGESTSIVDSANGDYKGF